MLASRTARRIRAGILSLGVLASPCHGQNEPPTPTEQFETLRRAYEAASANTTPLSDTERVAFIGRVFNQRHALAEELVELAGRHPDDPIALDALILAAWQVNTTPWPVELVGRDTARTRAFDLILRDHVGSDRLAPLCHRVSFGFATDYETFLRAVAAQSPHRNVRAAACLALGSFLKNRRQRLDLVGDQSEAADVFAGLFGREYVERLLRQNRDEATAEIEAILEQATAFGDVNLPDGATVAARAESALFEVRHLAVGRRAPEIEGEDQDGHRFRLSDYRGKVVLLDFWSYV